jgi:N-acetylmuramoyl-L-alanine amidase
MSDKDFIMGTLKSGGYLSTESGDILLTTTPMQAAQSPESAALEITPQDVGKTALVEGKLLNDTLYSAHITEIFSPVASRLVKTLINKGIVSLAQLKDILTEISSKEPKAIDVKKLCALVIGHKKSSPGAVNARSNLSEFDFNDNLAIQIEKKVQKSKVQRIYRRTYKELPGDINDLGPDFIVSLHCNAFNEKASGTEVLYYHKSEDGRKMAEFLLRHLLKCLDLTDRGVKPKTSEDRGGYLLRYTRAPCVIAEPFFIDNDEDLDKAQNNLDELAAAYAAAIDEISEMNV